MKDAIDKFWAVLRIDPNDADEHNNLGAVYSQQARVEAALRIYPNLAEAHHRLGLSYAQ